MTADMARKRKALVFAALRRQRATVSGDGYAQRGEGHSKEGYQSVAKFQPNF